MAIQKRQAYLRDKAFKESRIINVSPDTRSTCVRRIISKLRLEDMVLDIGCGTAHVMVNAAKRTGDVFYVLRRFGYFFSNVEHCKKKL